MTLREVIDRLEALSNNGKNDYMEVCVRNSEDRTFPFSVENIWIMQDPDYNFDEANCGPDEWIEISIDVPVCDYGEE